MSSPRTRVRKAPDVFRYRDPLRWLAAWVRHVRARGQDGARELAERLGCSRPHAYNLVSGARVFQPPYLDRLPAATGLSRVQGLYVLALLRATQGPEEGRAAAQGEAEAIRARVLAAREETRAMLRGPTGAAWIPAVAGALCAAGWGGEPPLSAVLWPPTSRSTSRSALGRRGLDGLGVARSFLPAARLSLDDWRLGQRWVRAALWLLDPGEAASDLSEGMGPGLAALAARFAPAPGDEVQVMRAQFVLGPATPSATPSSGVEAASAGASGSPSGLPGLAVSSRKLQI